MRIKYLQTPNLPKTPIGDNSDALTSEVKTALLACIQNLTWNDTQEGSAYYEALRSALYAESGNLPSAYQQVEYIATTRTSDTENAYIVTNATFSGNGAVIVEGKFRTTDATGAKGIVGCRQTSDSSMGLSVYVNKTSSVDKFGVYSPPFITEALTVVDGEDYSFAMTIANGNQSVSLTDSSDNTSTVSGASSIAAFANTPICVMGAKTSGDSNHQYPFDGRIYYVKVSEGGVPKLDLIPCYRKSDGVIGMYDLISNLFYTNAGSGSFTKGADVNAV